MAKKLTLASNPLGGGDNPPPALSLEQADRLVYGGVETPKDNRIVARPYSLADIRPDVKQPRRIIPVTVRRGWTGDAGKIPDLIREWRAQAERALGEPIDTQKLIEKFADGREADKDIPAIADEYLALCALAASIARDGLANPIHVTRGTPSTIVAGERRYMAYWLLKTWLAGNKWDSIPAVLVDAPDVWLQAAENGARRPLNAIGMARQLALLIMEMYVGDDGVKFDDITFFNHERQFYAQVANGVAYPIKKGLGERVLQVTGLNSKAQVNQYRALLKIDNDLWDEADAGNWAEFRIREMVKPQNRSTVVDLSAQNGGDKGHSIKPWGSDMPAPPPSIKSFGGDGRRVDAPVPMDEDDDEPMVVRPFASSPAPMPVDDYVPMDVRYVGGLLRHFVAWMIEHNIGAQDDVVGLRDCTPDRVRAWLGQYSQDEIAQMMSNWQMTVSEALVMVNQQLTETLDRIWEDVTNG